MKRYRLKKDLPTIRAGAEFKLNDEGDLVLSGGDKDDYGPFIPGVYTLYCKPTLDLCPNILADWFEEIPEEPKSVWDLRDGDECWVIEVSAYGPVASKAHWHEGLGELRSLGLILLTKEDAERDISRRLAREILLNDTKGFKPNWKKDKTKYEVYYDYEINKLMVEHWFGSCSHPDLWFATEEEAEASIETHGKEWKTYLGVEE